MEFLGHDIEHYIAMAAIFVTLVTPTARTLMALSHACQRYAAKTESKRDDAAAAKFARVMESICGTLAKVAALLPRLTVGR
jgi:ABC-type taurine transport system ATPase subunit